MEATPDNPRAFALPLKSLTQSERRLIVRKFGVNWDAVELDLADIPQPADRDNPTEDEKLAIARAFVKAVGPIERFALLYVAVKRKIPQASEHEIEKRADAGEWVLDLSPEDEPEVAGSDPLPPPPNSNETS